MRALWVALAGIAATSTGWSVPARAEMNWVRTSHDPLLDLSGLVPGDVGSATFTIVNPTGQPVAFSMRVVELVDDDNGCVEPESESGDTTCGRGGGELQADLMLRLGDGHGVIADRTLLAWAAAAATDPTILAANATRTYSLEYSLPLWSSNITQSDLVAFALEMRLDQASDGITAVEPPVVVIGATKQLPRTGVDIRTVTIAALIVGLLGVTVYRWSHDRRRPT